MTTTLLDQLSGFLREHCPCDVLIPCEIGEKRPMFPYRDESWTWEKFTAFCESAPMQTDWAIALRDICVIDIDCPDAARTLERLFPVLSEVPCERTARGFHYFFRRTPLADAQGFYDGAAQMIESVDFKSVAATGTAGILVTSPSTGKEWLRPLWSVPLINIPDNLLAHVARPSRPVRLPKDGPLPSPPMDVDGGRTSPKNSNERDGAEAASHDSAADLPESKKPRLADAAVAPAVTKPPDEQVLVTFEADHVTTDESGPPSLLVTGARLALVQQMDFCAALLSGRWSVAAAAEEQPTTLRLPCKRRDFIELLSLLESGSFTSERPPTDLLLARVEQLADMLGAPARTKNFLLERATFWADLYRIDPHWWFFSQREQALMLGTSPAASDAQLIAITHDMAQVCGVALCAWAPCQLSPC